MFSIPKPFAGHIGVIQRNALASWAHLANDVQIILCGDEDGVAENAREFGAVHAPDIERNKYGTPLISAAFASAAKIAKHQLLCYVNGDIMFTGDLIDAARSIRRSNFLMVGRRYNVDITTPWNFNHPHWQKELVEFTGRTGVLYRADALDYFVFPRASKLTNLPPFAVGRPRWDNYFLYRCRKLGYPLVDATGAVMAVHQNHDYSHVPGRTGYLWEGPEADENIRLLGDEARVFGLLDATHELKSTGLKKVSGPEYKARRRQTYLVLHPGRKVLFDAVSRAKSFVRRTGVPALLRRLGLRNSPSGQSQPKR